MGSAKELVLRPISAQEGNELVRRIHYSGKVAQNSQIHLGAFYRGALEGALQFGPSLDKRKILGLVRGTQWHEVLELNRMAFSDALPRNSESRALGVAMRLLRKHAPQVKWVVSFADATQCGDGTIYRAAGFVLTGIKTNSDIYELPDGSLANASSFSTSKTRRVLEVSRGGSGGTRQVKALGGVRAPGFQLRYLHFLDPTYRESLTVPEIPFSEIAKRGAGMYRGQKRAGSIASDAPATPGGGGRCNSDLGASVGA
jgi:hypothetical protein